jgi:cyanophycin synthetase
LLSEAGVPVPEGRPVADAAEAWSVAEEIGLPVVVKPRYGNQGRGVSVNLASREEVEQAWELAHAGEREVVVERYVSGGDYRVFAEVENRQIEGTQQWLLRAGQTATMTIHSDQPAAP